MQDIEPDADVRALESLTRVLVSVAWDSAHALPPQTTFPQMRLLVILTDLGRVSSAQLAAALGVNASSVTRLVDRLQSRGLVERGSDEHNRSVVTLEVTDAGQQAVAHVLRRRHAALRAVLDLLAPKQRQLTADVARQFTAAAAAVPSLAATGTGRL
ncbi:MAG TPA: MarR family transcriptional regulator [Pseudonocardiaceae bacterium]|nr:MarR family transcriptional regulator [Pseudonocardiaceae bacterium]